MILGNGMLARKENFRKFRQSESPIASLDIVSVNESCSPYPIVEVINFVWKLLFSRACNFWTATEAKVLILDATQKWNKSKRYLFADPRLCCFCMSTSRITNVDIRTTFNWTINFEIVNSECSILLIESFNLRDKYQVKAWRIDF